jgi:recombination protein RecT
VSVENQIVQMRGEFARAIGGATPQEQQKRAERFARVCVTAFRQNPKLQQCTAGSILGAMMVCAQLDLEPNTPSGLAYLIPYGRECQFQVGYKGLLQLMYRSGAIASFNADVVYRGELERGLFRYTSGIHPNIEHEIDLLDNSARSGEPKDIVAAYAAVTLKSGEPVMRLVTKKEIDQARVQGGRNSPAWRDHYAAMAIKTAIKRLAQWLPQTKVDEAFAAEDKYIEAEAKPAEAPQVGMSLETMNAMMQAGQAQAVEAPQEAPAVEQAPAPQPEPIPETVKQRFPLSAAKSTIPVGEDEEPAPKEERPAAFRPAQEAQTASTGISIDVQWDDYWADRNGDGEPEARDACFKMVQAGEAKDMQEAKARWLAQAQSMDAEQF